MTEAIYTSRIIKASALIADTKMLLSSWDLEKSVTENLDHARRENVFGKASRMRVEDIMMIFRQRYFNNQDIGIALVTLVQKGAPANWIDPLLYYYAAQNDRTLRDIVLEVVFPRRMSGYSDLQKEYIIRALRDWISEEKTTNRWSENTLERVARNSQAALRDFGVLKGKVLKSIAPLYLPIETFAFIALDLLNRLGSGQQVLQSEEWKLFFLPVEGVERFFLEAHQKQLLSYFAAGSVIRLEFPITQPYTLTDFANVILERSFS